MRHFSRYLYFISGITLIALYIPFFILLNQQDRPHKTIYKGVSLQGSSISSVMKNSSTLIIAQMCIIVGILPMILDIIMDSQVLSKLPDLWGDRCMIVFILIVPSLTFLVFRESPFMPLLYVVQFLSQNMLYPSVMIHSVREDICAVSPIMVPSLCVLALTLFGVRCVFEAYITLFNFDGAPLRVAGSNVFMVLSWMMALLASVIWLYKLWISGKFGVMSFRFQKVVPVLAFLITAVACLITNSIFKATTWPDVREESLVSYAFIQLVYAVLMTVLPGRVARVEAELRMENLTLKGFFVRFISHEIRSPLNVVVSGLDFLKDEVKNLNGPARDKLEGLLDEMTVASSSAVNMLTDVLDYELIDAGLLKLERSWWPLDRFLEDKLKWAELLAGTKQIRLSIEDETVSTTLGLRNLRGKVSRAIADTELVIRDIEEGDVFNNHSARLNRSQSPIELPPFARSFLHVDSSKIVQFLRNVVTNAINHSPVGGSVSIKVNLSPATGFGPSTFSDEAVVRMLRIEVCDSGKGFAAEEQEKISTDLLRFNGRDLKGEGNVGLGLWIAQGIVKLHQGTFNLYSDGVEHGCRVVAELPLYAYPTTPVSQEDQLKFSDIFRAMESCYFREDDCGDGISVVEETSNAEVSLFNAFQDSMDDKDETAEVVGARTQIIVPEMDRGSVHNVVDLSQYQDIPFLEDISEREVDHAAYDKDRSSFKGSHISFSAHSKVYPNALTDPSDGRDGDKRESSEVKVKPSSESSVVAAGEGPKKPTDRWRFLIVDDSALNRKIIRRILESDQSNFSNAVIEEADDGVTAVSAVQSAMDAGLTFDCIFMDFVMTTLNGPEAAKILRSNLKFRNAIIGVTGNALPADIALFTSSGADQIMLKPLNKAQFLTVLMSFIDNRD